MEPLGHVQQRFKTWHLRCDLFNDQDLLSLSLRFIYIFFLILLLYIFYFFLCSFLLFKQFYLLKIFLKNQHFWNIKIQFIVQQQKKIKMFWFSSSICTTVVFNITFKLNYCQTNRMMHSIVSMILLEPFVIFSYNLHK